MHLRQLRPATKWSVRSYRSVARRKAPAVGKVDAYPIPDQLTRITAEGRAPHEPCTNNCGRAWRGRRGDCQLNDLLCRSVNPVGIEPPTTRQETISVPIRDRQCVRDADRLEIPKEQHPARRQDDTALDAARPCWRYARKACLSVPEYRALTWRPTASAWAASAASSMSRLGRGS